MENSIERVSEDVKDFAPTNLNLEEKEEGNLFRQTEPLEFEENSKLMREMQEFKKGYNNTNAERKKFMARIDLLASKETNIPKITSLIGDTIELIDDLLSATIFRSDVEGEIQNLKKRVVALEIPRSLEGTNTFFEDQKKTIEERLTMSKSECELLSKELRVAIQKFNAEANKFREECYQPDIDKIKERLDFGEEIYVKVGNEKGRLLDVKFFKKKDSGALQLLLCLIDSKGKIKYLKEAYSAKEISREDFVPEKGWEKYQEIVGEFKQLEETIVNTLSEGAVIKFSKSS